MAIEHQDMTTSRARMRLQGLARWRPELEEELGPLPTGFFDTPIIVYLLKTRQEYFKRCFVSASTM